MRIFLSALLTLLMVSSLQAQIPKDSLQTYLNEPFAEFSQIKEDLISVPNLSSDEFHRALLLIMSLNHGETALFNIVWHLMRVEEKQSLEERCGVLEYNFIRLRSALDAQFIAMEDIRDKKVRALGNNAIKGLQAGFYECLNTLEKSDCKDRILEEIKKPIDKNQK